MGLQETTPQGVDKNASSRQPAATTPTSPTDPLSADIPPSDQTSSGSTYFSGKHPTQLAVTWSQMLIEGYTREPEGYFNYCNFTNPEALPSVYSHIKACKSTWGEFYASANLAKLFDRNAYLLGKIKRGAINVAVLGSFMRGMRLLDDLLTYEKLQGYTPGTPATLSYNDKPFDLVVSGFCTDRVAPNAKISAHRRIWNYIPSNNRDLLTQAAILIALQQSMPIFTGEVKSDLFVDALLPYIMSKPDVLLSATFGQILSKEIIEFPRYGAYNFHPSDLTTGQYKGGDPFKSMIEAGETTTRMTLHHTDPGIDTGRVVGVSPKISIEVEEPEKWTLNERVIAAHIRSSSVVGYMALILLSEIYEQKKPIDHTIAFEDYFRGVHGEQYLEKLLKPCEEDGVEHLLARDILGQEHSILGPIMIAAPETWKKMNGEQLLTQSTGD